MVRPLASCLLAALPLLAQAQQIAVEEFFKRPAYSQLKLSPDGKLVAAIVPGEKRDRLAVLDLETRKGRPVTNFADADVLEFHWINDHRLVLSVGDAHVEWANAEYYGWYAVNADGSRLEVITVPMGGPGHTGPKWAPIRYLGPHPAGGEDILVEAHGYEKVSVLRVDTMGTRPLRSLGGGELNGVRQWIVDFRGALRVARSYQEGRERVWYRDNVTTPWRLLEEAEEGKLDIRPLAFDFDNRTMYVASYDGGDKLAIFKYDFEKNRLGERVARHLDFDMDGLVFSRAQRRLLGFKFEGAHANVVWVDEHMARVQQMIDRALPNTFNSINVAEQNPKRVLVSAYSDIAPTSFYLLDIEKRAMEKFSSSRPWIKAPEMSERKLVRYKARDGLEIPAFLTIPKGSSGKNLPVVVEIHGGPWIERQGGGFNPNAQFLASRGYAVLQPDFRGTLGYGKHHFEASFGQWGYAMQDDITDGAEWLIQQGIADKNRICLFGASYGGYATLWGLMKTPDLYRCGVAYVAVTDIGAMFSFNRWDWASSLWMDRDEAHRRIGDPDRDAEKFAAVSPVAQAARLKAPVLLAYGGADQRVPLKQGNALRSALDRYDKTYEWVVYDDEGHGFNDDKNRVDFWRRVDVFLHKYLTDPATQQ